MTHHLKLSHHYANAVLAGQVSLREFDRWNGEIRDLPLVVKDGRVYAEDDNGER